VVAVGKNDAPGGGEDVVVFGLQVAFKHSGLLRFAVWQNERMRDVSRIDRGLLLGLIRCGRRRGFLCRYGLCM
jgi:hypothetical protein